MDYLKSLRLKFLCCTEMANDTMIVTNTPARYLVSTNFAYCSLIDLRRLAAPGSRLVFAYVGDSWVLSLGYPLPM